MQEDNDFVQAGNLYRDVMSETDRQHLVNNIVGHMSQGVERFIQERTVNTYWYPVVGLEITSELASSVGGE